MPNKELQNLQNQHHHNQVHKKASNNVQNTDTNDMELVAYAAPMTHDKCFDVLMNIVNNHSKGKNINVLILGAGSGYFDQRLLDAGIKNIDAIEYIPEHYKVKSTRLFSYDLNQDWAQKLLSKNGNHKYDVVIAIEVIEHLENSFLLMREISNILYGNKDSNNDHSVLILTTPNINNSFSRMRFLISGYLEYFGQSELLHTGHIHPIIPHILKFNLDINNFKIINIHNNRNVWQARIKDSKGYKKVAIIALYIIARLTIYKKEEEGEINIYEISN